MEKVGEGGRRCEKVGEGGRRWRRWEKVGEDWRRLEKVVLFLLRFVSDSGPTGQRNEKFPANNDEHLPEIMYARPPGTAGKAKAPEIR